MVAGVVRKRDGSTARAFARLAEAAQLFHTLVWVVSLDWNKVGHLSFSRYRLVALYLRGSRPTAQPPPPLITL